jgi:outer membrane receptor protein involved in Fe transport
MTSLLAAATLQAADESQSGQKAGTKDERLEEILITGSLIPRPKEETAVPTSTITAEDLRTKGFATVADALQQASFSSGSVQGSQFVNGFTPGAQTLSLFGLSPSYVKYLIDGRPMADYPALYNGTDIITNISGIPEEMVDHIDILPGGQSSLYGSDAIAGVVNIVLRKHLDAPVVDVRLSGFQDGGGTDRRISLANSFEFGRLTILTGAQYQNTDPIWAYQRELTSQVFTGGTGPAVAERDWLVYSPFSGTYYFSDPNNCLNVDSLFGNTVGMQGRAHRAPDGISPGNFCGTFKDANYTLNNGQESTQLYLHANADLTGSMQLYSDLLYSHEITRFSTGTRFWSTQISYPFGVIYDPNIGDYVGLQHIFSPEEIGGLNNTINPDTTNALSATLGIQGDLPWGHWTYDLGFTHTQQRLNEGTQVLFTAPVEAFFASVLGPNLGPDPFGNGVPTYMPNYAQFYSPITPAQYASFSGIASSFSGTEDNMLRGQLTNSQLFKLPGGNAGIALVAEGGDEGWHYDPDPRFLNGGTWGYTAVAGSGHRSRYAITAELRLPVARMLTVTGSGRYDAYKVAGNTASKSTYNLGLEFRPATTLLLRGRYGTAFKVPTLSDEFQGQSGFFTQVNDYYWCQLHNQPLGSCLQAGIDVFGTTEGNPALKPINAKVWNVGLVWAPVKELSLSADYLSWSISNEVNQQSSDQLLITENQCRQGILDITSPTCVAALSQVHRDAFNLILSIDIPKINVSDETVNTFVANARYDWALGGSAHLIFDLNWNDMLKHTNQVYPGDPLRDALSDPTWSTEFKSKIDLSMTWKEGDWSSTAYIDAHGRSPNFIATVNGYGDPRATNLPAWVVANLSISYQWSRQLQLTGNVINLSDSMPPVDRSYPGTTSQPYDIFNYNIYGRAYRMEINYKFK